MGNRLVSPESATEWLLKLIVWEFFCTFGHVTAGAKGELT